MIKEMVLWLWKNFKSHIANSSAHHTKTIDASELTSGQLADARFVNALLKDGSRAATGAFLFNSKIKVDYATVGIDTDGIEWYAGDGTNPRYGHFWIDIYSERFRIARDGFGGAAFEILSIDKSGNITPRFSSGYQNLGDATYYFNDISYKTLTDRGCLGLFEHDIEMPNGEILSAIDALEAIQPHPTRKTRYGKKQLDYRKMPKVVFKPAANNDGTLYERDENDEPKPFIEEIEGIGSIEKHPTDGAELTALVSIMISAIKELSIEIEKLKIEKRTK